MGTFSRTCHLSSLEIEEGMDVVLIPVKYSYVSHPHLVNAVNSQCSVAALPLFGKYNGVGSIDLDPKSIPICDIFKNEINHTLMNNTEYRKKVKQQLFAAREPFYIFKREEYNQVEKMYFYSDHDLIQLANNEKKLFEIEKLDDNDEFLSILSDGSLVSIDSRTVTRFSFQLIRKDIYDAMVTDVYKTKQSRIKKNISQLFNTKTDDDSLFALRSRDVGHHTLELFNFDSYLPHKINMLISAYIKNKKTGNEKTLKAYKDAMLTFSLIAGMYANLGKTFYPNALKQSDMTDTLALHSIIAKQVKADDINKEEY